MTSLSRIRLVFEGLLVAAFVIGGWMYNRQQEKLADTEAKLEEGGRLAEDLREQVRVSNGRIEMLKRDSEGKVRREVVYLPPEGEYKIQYHIRSSTPVVTIKDKGFCLRPGFGATLTSKGLTPRLDLKWAFWGRYSALGGVNRYGAGVGISRHLDDILWGHPQNIEFFLEYKPWLFSDVRPIMGGIRTNF